MIRKFNYTGRKEIPASSVKIYFEDVKHIPYTFNAEINLDSLKLPGNADVFIEAYDTSSYMRFPFGKVAEIIPPAAHDRRLTDIHSTDAVMFRIKIIDNSGTHGKILAWATSIATTEIKMTNSKKVSILPVGYKDLDQEIWRLEIEDRPILFINKDLIQFGIREVVRNDNCFISLVYPAVVREILTHIFFIENIFDTDGNDWMHNWLKFITSIQGITDIPKPEYDDNNRILNKEQFIEWINLDAIPSFSKKFDIKSRYEVEISEVVK